MRLLDKNGEKEREREREREYSAFGIAIEFPANCLSARVQMSTMFLFVTRQIHMGSFLQKMHLPD